MKREPINGWTKESIIKHIKENFKGQAVITDVSGNEYCAYLTKCGKKCAVGLFIPDGHEAQQSTGDLHEVLRKYPDLRKIMPLEEGALSDLQEIHDYFGADRAGILDRMLDYVNDNVESR